MENQEQPTRKKWPIIVVILIFLAIIGQCMGGKSEDEKFIEDYNNFINH